MTNQPKFNPEYIDSEETQKDFTAREILKMFLTELITLKNMADDTALVLGSDLYQSHFGYYQNVKLLSNQNVNGAKAIYDDLAAQFPKNVRRKAKPNA